MVKNERGIGMKKDRIIEDILKVIYSENGLVPDDTIFNFEPSLKLRNRQKKEIINALEERIRNIIDKASCYSQNYSVQLESDNLLPSLVIVNRLNTYFQEITDESIIEIINKLKQFALKEELTLISEKRVTLGKELFNNQEYYVGLALDEFNLTTTLEKEEINEQKFKVETDKKKLKRALDSNKITLGDYQREIKILDSLSARLLTEEEISDLRYCHNKAIFLNEIANSKGESPLYSEDYIKGLHDNLTASKNKLTIQTAYFNYLNGTITEDEANEIIGKAEAKQKVLTPQKKDN